MNLLLLSIILLPILLGLIASLTSFLPYEWVNSRLIPFTLDGSVYFFTETFFEQLITKLRISATGLFLVGGLLYFGQQKVRQYLLELQASMISSLRRLILSLVSFIKEEEKVHLFAFFTIILLAIGIRIFFLFQPMRYDEAHTFIYYASKPLYIGLSYYSAPNNHLFHTLLVHLTYSLFGNHPWALRLPALFAGILMVPASYLAIRTLYNKQAALLTAALVGSSSILIDYSTNARGYTLICLIFLSILPLSKYLKDHQNPSGWFLWMTLSAFGLYTIPTMLYPFGIVVSWILLSVILKDTKDDHRSLFLHLLSAFMATILLTSLFYLPVFIASGIESIVANSYTTSHLWTDFISNSLSVLHSTWSQWTRDLPHFITILLVIGFFGGLLLYRRLSTHRVPIILAVITFCLPILMIQRISPPDRSWLFLLPLFFGLASLGLTHLVRLSKIKIGDSFIIPILAITLSSWLSYDIAQKKAVYHSDETGTFRSAKNVALFLKEQLRPGDRVLSDHPSDLLLEYYFSSNHIPISFLHSDLEETDRMFVVIHQKREQTLDGILKEVGLSDAPLSTPKLIEHFREGTVYEIKRL